MNFSNRWEQDDVTMTTQNRRYNNNNNNNIKAVNNHYHDNPHSHHDNSLPVPSLRPLHAYLLIVTIATICYGNSYNAGFVFDDSEAIIGNKDLQPSVPIANLFEHDFWGNRLKSNTSHKSYRPLTVLTFRLNYYLAGGLDPLGFHVVNIVLHAVVCALLLPVFNILLLVPRDQKYVDQAALLGVLFFTVHPIHTESVAGVVGRADLLCAITFILSFLCYHTALLSNIGVFGCDVRLLLLSMFLCVVSTFCKEIGITSLGVCFACDVFIISKIDLLEVLRLRKSCANNQGLRVPQGVVYRFLMLCVTGLIILAIRWQIQGSSPPVFQVVDNPHSFVNNTILRVLNYNYIYSLNAWVMLNPWWLCFDWSTGCVPVIESLVDGRLLAVAAFWLLLGSVIGCCLLQPASDEQRCLLMALAFLVIPFLPASNLLFRVGFVLAERVLYLPSVGYCMLLVLGIRRLSSHTLAQKVCHVLVLFLLVLYAARSYTRSLDWQNDQRLFEAGELVCPLNAKVHYNIAKIHGDLGNTSYAVERYRLAIKLHPEYDQAMNNLANILKEQGELIEAEQLLLQATSLRYEFAAAWMNLGIVQASLNKPVQAEESYHIALRQRRKYPDCFYNLGNLYLSLEKHTLALSAWRNATLQKPNHSNAWNNMIILLDNLGRLADIEIAVTEALRHLPEDSGIFYNYANALGKAGKFPEAEVNFLKAIKIHPRKPAYYANLAVLYHRWEKWDKAEQLYQRAMQLDPSSQMLQSNYKLLLNKLGKQN